MKKWPPQGIQDQLPTVGTSQRDFDRRGCKRRRKNRKTIHDLRGGTVKARQKRTPAKGGGGHQGGSETGPRGGTLLLPSRPPTKTGLDIRKQNFLPPRTKLGTSKANRIVAEVKAKEKNYTGLEGCSPRSQDRESIGRHPRS